MSKLHDRLRQWLAGRWGQRGVPAVRTWPVHARPPGKCDDVSWGFRVGDVWAVPGDTRAWSCIDNSGGCARWDEINFLGGIGERPARAVYGTKRLRTRYAGPLLSVVNPLTGIESDIGFTAGNQIDRVQLLSAMANARFLQVAVVYDQSGNGNHAVQAEPAARPLIKPGPPAANGVSLIFDPPTEAGGMFLSIPETLCWPAGTPSSQLAVVSFQSWFSSNTQISALRNAGDEHERLLSWASIHNTLYVATPDHAGVSVNWPRAPCLPASQFVTGYSSTPEATGIWVNNASLTVQGGFGPAMAGGMVGAATAPGGGGMQLSALAIYDHALTVHERRSANAFMYHQFAVAPQIRDTIICDGDSITWGFGAAFNETWPGQLATMLQGRYIVASSGACGIEASDRVSKTLTPDVLTSWFPTPRAKNILVFFAGTNDLVAGRTAKEIYESHRELVRRCQSHGIKVVLVTILPRLGFSLGGVPPGSMEAERLNLNALIRTNAAGADGVADAAGHPRLRDLSDDILAYFPDGVHPSSFPTCAMIASAVADTINNC